MRRQSRQSGFSILVALLAVSAVAVIAIAGVLLVKHSHNNKKPTSEAAASLNQTASQPLSNANAQTQPAATQQPSAVWNTYNDTGYGVASGISIKYPADWRIDIPGVKAVGNTTKPTAAIKERVVFLPFVETPKDEWNTCAANISGDACGAAPGDKTLSGSESIINGIAAYSATMQNSYYTYNVTVLRGNKPTPNGIAYVEFTISASDPAILNSYDAAMASVTFPN